MRPASVHASVTRHARDQAFARDELAAELSAMTRLHEFTTRWQTVVQLPAALEVDNTTVLRFPRRPMESLIEADPQREVCYVTE
jgi:hypothetical protein